jgi:hypothetical protein
MMEPHWWTQQIVDTVKHMAGKEAIALSAIPDQAIDAFSRVAAAFRYGVATGNASSESQEWDGALEQELSATWTELAPTKPWVEARGHVRRGWDAVRAARRSQSGRIDSSVL